MMVYVKRGSLGDHVMVCARVEKEGGVKTTGKKSACE